MRLLVFLNQQHALIHAMGARIARRCDPAKKRRSFFGIALARPWTGIWMAFRASSSIAAEASRIWRFVVIGQKTKKAVSFR